MSGQFSKWENEQLVEHWDECHGDPKTLQQWAPDRTVRAIQAHVRTEGFVNALHRSGLYPFEMKLTLRKRK